MQKIKELSIPLYHTSLLKPLFCSLLIHPSHLNLNIHFTEKLLTSRPNEGKLPLITFAAYSIPQDSSRVI